MDIETYNFWQDVWNAEYNAEQTELAEQAESIRAEQADHDADLRRELDSDD